MKKILFCVIAFAAVLTSCIKSESEGKDVVSVDQLNLITTEEFEVPIKEGYITKVYYNGEEIANAVTPMTISVPKGTATRADFFSLLVDHLQKVFGVNYDNSNWSKSWQTVAFEDTKNNSDYDYNDVVFQAKLLRQGQTLKIGIHPIAMGGSRKVGLGYKLFIDGKEVADEYLTDDIRKYVFEGREGFINTHIAVPTYKYPSFTMYSFYKDKKLNQSSVSVVWYIIPEGKADGERLYAVNAKYNALDDNNRPYGIVICNSNKKNNGNWQDKSIFEYPVESQNISGCNINFDRWMQGQGSLDFDDAVNVFPAEDLYEMTQAEENKLESKK